MNAVINGTVSIGMCSRDVKKEEKAKLGDYKEYLVSKDCLAFAVNKDNPLAQVDNLTREDVVKIYSGEAKTFTDLRSNLPAKPILVQMRDMAGGSTEMVQKLILKDKTFTPSALQVPSQGANLKKLGNQHLRSCVHLFRDCAAKRQAESLQVPRGLSPRTKMP